MKLLIFVNSKAGSYDIDQTENEINQYLQAYAEETGKLFTYDICAPSNPDELRETLKKRLSQEKIDTVVMVGGDGTVMEALSTLIQFPEVNLAIIPRGTGNLLAINVGIPREIDECIRLIFEGRSRPLDLGKIGDKVFGLIAGVGFDAEIMETVNANSQSKRLMGIWAYFVEGIYKLFNLKTARFTVTIDGRKHKAKGVTILVSNAANYLGQAGLILTPNANPWDGYFDICFVKVTGKADYIPVITQILTQSYDQNTNQIIQQFQGRKIKIESKPTMKVQADGNVIGSTPVEIEMLSGAIKLMVPADIEEESK